MGSHCNSRDTETTVCRSATRLCDEEITLSRDNVDEFIEDHDIDLSETVLLSCDVTLSEARHVEADQPGRYEATDSAGGGGSIDKTYPAVTDTLEDDIREALVEVVDDPTSVDSVLEPLRAWKHGSYYIHTPSAVPDSLLNNDDGLAHYAQTHELLCQEALNLDGDARNGDLNGRSPQPDEIRVLQYIHALSRRLLDLHNDGPPYQLYRGIGGMAFAEVGRQLLDDEQPPIEIDEQVVLANFTPIQDVAASFRGLVIEITVPLDAIAIAADQLFKCRSSDGNVTNCHAEIRVATSYYSSLEESELILPSGTSAVEFVEELPDVCPDDHRFMASLLNAWFGAEEPPGNVETIPGTETAYERIDDWYSQYESLLEQRIQQADDSADADRYTERLRIVNDLKKSALSYSEENDD